MVILHQESLQANQDLEAGADGEETVKETSQLEVKIPAMQSNKEDITNSHSFTDSREDINIDEECGRISGVHKHSNDDVWKVKEDDRTKLESYIPLVSGRTIEIPAEEETSGGTIQNCEVSDIEKTTFECDGVKPLESMSVEQTLSNFETSHYYDSVKSLSPNAPSCWKARRQGSNEE